MSTKKPAERVYINVLIKARTRAAMNKIKARDGFATQGALIDALVERYVRDRKGAK